MKNAIVLIVLAVVLAGLVALRVVAVRRRRAA